MKHSEEMAMLKHYPLAAKHAAISIQSFSHYLTRINPVGITLKGFKVATKL